MNKNITIMIFTRNEENRLPYIYENLKNFCEIIVFDGGSTDGTLDYCDKNNIKYLIRPAHAADDTLEENTYKWAHENVSTEYVLNVICSHFYPKELLDKFSNIADENRLEAVYHDVVVHRYGQVVHKPILRRVASACNFYKKSTVNFEQAKIHDELAIQFNKDNMIRLDARDELSLHLFQDDDCHGFINKTSKYATIEANQRFMAGKKVGFTGVFFKPLLRFFYSYFRSGAFIHGMPGLIYSVLNLVYDFNVNIVLWELSHDLSQRKVIEKNNLVREKLIKNSNNS